MKKFILVLVCITLCCSQQLNGTPYGARAVISAEGLNKIKSSLFNHLLPSESIEFEMPSKKFNGVTLESPQITINIKDSDVSIGGKDQLIELNVMKAKIDFFAVMQFFTLNYKVEVSPSCSFSFLLKPTQSEQGQFLIDNIQIQQFDLNEEEINLPKFLMNCRTYITQFISQEIKQQLQQRFLPGFVQQINQKLLESSSTIPIPQTQISFDGTFLFSHINNHMLILDSHFYAFSNERTFNQGGKNQNPVEFPEMDYSSSQKSDLTLFLSEHSLNSALKAVFEQNYLNSEIDLLNQISLLNLNQLLPGLTDKFHKSNKLILRTETTSAPELFITQHSNPLLILNQSFELRAVVGTSEYQVLKVKTTIKLELEIKVQDNLIVFQIKNFSFQSVKFNDSESEQSFIKKVLPYLFKNQHKKINEKLEQHPIELKSHLFKFGQPKLSMLNHYIQIEGQIE